MKEIKFRVWDNTKNMWVNHKVAIDADGNPFLVLPGGIIHKLDKSHINIQFYAGLKDKNGKEIYEGDILKCLNKSEHTKKEYWFPVYKMEYEKLSFVLTHIGGGKSFDYPSTRLSMGNRDYEIIGNIYENKELLNENN